MDNWSTHYYWCHLVDYKQTGRLDLVDQFMYNLPVDTVTSRRLYISHSTSLFTVDQLSQSTSCPSTRYHSTNKYHNFCHVVLNCNSLSTEVFMLALAYIVTPLIYSCKMLITLVPGSQD